jgi:hypothetical protein
MITELRNTLKNRTFNKNNNKMSSINSTMFTSDFVKSECKRAQSREEMAKFKNNTALDYISTSNG